MLYWAQSICTSLQRTQNHLSVRRCACSLAILDVLLLDPIWFVRDSAWSTLRKYGQVEKAETRDSRVSLGQ